MSTTASSSTFVYAIDWAELPADVQATLRELGPELSDGESMQGLARRLGCSSGHVQGRVAAARLAILEQLLDRLDGLAPATRERLLVEVDALTTPR